MTVFVTGASGYLGSWIARGLAERGYAVTAGTREPLSTNSSTSGLRNVAYGDLRKRIDWNRHLSGIDVLVHTAGFVHRREPLSDADTEDAKLLNDDLVKDIAESAVRMRVKHVILISTIAVHGRSGDGVPVNEVSPLLPETRYAKTKLSGEKQLIRCCKDSATSWTILRPVMVYGSECPGNFPDLVRAVRLRIPLPFKNVRNRRSFIYIENLVDLVALCVQKPEARNEIFLAADPETVSVSQMISWIAQALDKRPFMWPFPVPILRSAASLFGKSSQVSSLVDDFVVDSQKAIDVLDWRSTYDTHRGILRSLSGS